MKKILLSILLIFICSTAQAKNYCLDANAQGCWLFKEGTGTSVADSSQNTNTGNFKASGEPAWDTTDVSFATQGTAPNSVDFYSDSNSDYIKVTQHSSVNNLSSFSYVAWIYKDSIPGTFPRYFTKGDIKLAFDDTTNLFFVVQIVTDGSVRYARLQDSTYFPQGAWTHLAITYANGNAPKIYLNATEATYGGSSAGSGTDSDDSAEDFYIGDRSGGDRPFDGHMTEVALFDRVLSQAEIQEIMNYGLEGKGIFINVFTN